MSNCIMLLMKYFFFNYAMLNDAIQEKYLDEREQHIDDMNMEQTFKNNALFPIFDVSNYEYNSFVENTSKDIEKFQNIHSEIRSSKDANQEEALESETKIDEKLICKLDSNIKSSPLKLLRKSISEQIKKSKRTSYLYRHINSDNGSKLRKNYIDVNIKDDLCLTRKKSKIFETCKVQRFCILTKKISLHETKDFISKTSDFAEIFYDILDLNFMSIIRDQVFQNVIESQNLDEIFQSLEEGLKENESMLLKQIHLPYAAENHNLCQETFSSNEFCCICLTQKFNQQKIEEFYYDLFLSTSLISKIIPDKAGDICRFIIDELNRVFMLLKNSQSYEILFSDEIRKLHRNITKLMVCEEILDLSHHYKFYIKHQLLHSHIHNFLFTHTEMKISLFQEFTSLTYILQKRNILDKIKYNNVFLVLYYSIICFNLVFDTFAKNNDIKFLLENKDKWNNQFILHVISFLIRQFYVQPIIACFELDINIILRYSYLIKKEFQIDTLVLKTRNLDEIFYQNLQKNLTFVLCIHSYIPNSVFLGVFKDKIIINDRRLYIWFKKTDIFDFEFFIRHFKNQKFDSNIPTE